MFKTLITTAAIALAGLLPATAQQAPTGPAISAEFPYEHKFVEVLGSNIAYVDEGQGDPILFIHGNPTSSYLWRNIMPYAEPYGRVIALDLIGMGKSDKPDLDYTYGDHIQYLEGFIAALDLENITLVIHDWGSAMGMDYARRHQDNVKAMAFLEAIVAPAMPVPSYEAMGPVAGEFFRNVRTPGVGEEMILKQNLFAAVLLPEAGVVRDMSDEEKATYVAPYPDEKSRIPTLQWPREVPIAGEPAHTAKLVVDNGKWLKETDIPKLYFYAEPGALNPAPVVEYFQTQLKNIETRYVGVGTHFLQEDNPHAIGRGLADWLRRQ